MVNQLTVDTQCPSITSLHRKGNPNLTPRTSSTSSNTNTSTNTSTPYNTVRGQSDIRSPGISKTPSIVSSDGAEKHAHGQPPSPTSTTQIPDFITQTDKYGNASTPRNPHSHAASSSANNHQPQLEQTDTEESEYPVAPHEQEDACDTLLESLRMMCCCLLPETNPDLARGATAHHPHANVSSKNHSNAMTERKFQITKQRRANGGGSVYGHVDESANFHISQQIKLLPPKLKEDRDKPCLVLDLDETLVHSSFRAVAGADFVIPVQIEDVVHYVYVAKRPGVDEFLLEMAKHYEIILYTASLNKYADPLLDLLDPHQTIRTRLFRESCVYYEGNYVKDLSLLDRDLRQTIIVDNSPSSYIFHPKNAIDCSSFIDDVMDVELDQIGGFLKSVRKVKDMREVCALWKDWPNIDVKGMIMDELAEDSSLESRQDKHVS